MRLKHYLKEKKELTAKEFIEWIKQFPKSGRSPKGLKKEFGNLKFLQSQAFHMEKYGFTDMSNVLNTLSWYADDPREAMKKFEEMFGGKKTVDKIKKGKITYINRSAMAEKTFIKKAKQIDKFISTLKGFHAKILTKPIKIYFKPTNQMRSRAVYKKELDEIWVKQSAKADNELYGHLLYIILHELGHRWEKFYGLPKEWRDKGMYTTKYSKTEGFSSEAFAELFALSHWDNKYKEYSEQIEKFKKMMR